MNNLPFFTALLLILATAHGEGAYRFKIGAAEATIVSDGFLTFQTLGYSVPQQAVERAYRTNFRQINPYLLEQNIIVVDLPGGRVMVDAGSANAGAPEFVRAGLLIENLRAAGISPASIDAIMLTHAHPDHVAGLTKIDRTGAFRNAVLYIHREEHEFWSSEGDLDLSGSDLGEEFANLIRDIYVDRIEWYEARGKLRLVEDFATPMEGIRFIPSKGHSPGHATIEISSEGKRVLVIGDAFFTKSDQVQNPEWGFFIETNQTQGYLSRVELLENAEKEEDIILSYHEEFPGLGRIRKVGPFFDWLTAGLQSDGDDVRPLTDGLDVEEEEHDEE